jgi:D-3-phosphoglycerate dehydrogenase
MKPKVLRTNTEVEIGKKALNDLRKVADVVTSSSNNEETLTREAEDVDLIIVSHARITARIIESARKLKGIVKHGVGVDNIDLEAATKNGILVVNCPEYGSETVADHAFALMICFARKIIQIDKAIRRKGWVWPSPKYMGVDLYGKTLGLIGVGRIGRAMARRAGGLGMKIVAFDPYVKQDSVRGLDLRFVSIDELLTLSDFISIHCVLTPETRGLIGKNEFQKMKKTAFLINVSRGAIVDEKALVTALKEGSIAGGGFDVFSEEPLSHDNPLLDMDNVILTPHLAWYSKEAFERVVKEAVHKVTEILQGKTPKDIVNIKVLEKPVLQI